MEYRTAYGPRERVTIDFPLKSLAQQSFRDECNIATIMARFEKTGILEHFNAHQGRYGDFEGVQDYQTSLNQVMEAQRAFETLPAKVRAAFENNPAKFLKFAMNPENEDEMYKLGLKKRPQTAAEPPSDNGEALKLAKEALAKAIAAEEPPPNKTPPVV